MAVPTITGVTPDSGSTRGQNLITIMGTNFRLAGPISVEDGSVKSRKSVSVQFDGVESEYAQPVDDTKIIARVPQYRGDYKVIPKSMTVRVANLDNDQVEIPGENVELADGYTVERPKLTLTRIDVRVMEQFIKAVRTHVHENVWFTTDRHYWDLSQGVPDQIRNAASLPLIHINGLGEEANPDQQQRGMKSVEISPGEWVEIRPGRAVDIVLGAIEIYSNASHINEITNLGQAFLDFVEECPFLRVAPESWDVDADDYEYPISVPDDAIPTYELGSALDGFKYCRTGAIIEGLELREPNEQAQGWTRDWTTLELDFHLT